MKDSKKLKIILPLINDFTGNVLKFDKFPEANCNIVYKLESEKGDYVLKIACGEKRKKEIITEAGIINSLVGKVDVPEVLASGQNGDMAYILMKFIEGQTAKQMLDSKEYSKDFIFDLGKILKDIHNVELPNKYEYGLVLKDKLKEAKENMDNRILDLSEFDNKQPLRLLEKLNSTHIDGDVCLLHGDFRPKNIIHNKIGNYVIDWGFSGVGDPYYDLAIILYYFNDEERQVFLKGYVLDYLDVEKLKYYDSLNKFLNA